MLDVKSELEKLGLKIAVDAGTEYALYCPFHRNSDSPAFYINKRTGLWICFNPDCGAKGSLHSLSKKLGGHDDGHIYQSLSDDDVDRALEAIIEHKEEEAEDWSEAIERISIDYDKRDEVAKLQYLIDRGYSPSTLKHFGVGFSEKKNLIVIPARNERYQLVGFIGRQVDPNVKPKYKYSKGFPRKDILFNLNNAKHHQSVIVVEGSLDAMMIHQAGLPNVVATLGANVTDHHIELLNGYFDEIVVFYDNDDPGRAMLKRIINECSYKNIKIVVYPSEDIKDAGELSAEQIRKMVEESVDCLSWIFDQGTV